MIMHKPRTTAIVAYSLFILAIVLAFGSFYSIMTIRVLADWTMTLPDGPIHAGDTIIIKSEYTKLRDVSGTAHRYIDCDTTKGIRLSYLLNEREADRQSGKGGTGIEVVMPTNISNLPTQCDVRVVIDYRVVPFKNTTEINQTKDFTLLPNPGAGYVISLPVSTYRSPAQAAPVSQSYPSSSSNNTAPTVAPQSNIPTSSFSTTTNTTNNTVTNTPAPEQKCAISVLGFKLGCE